MSDTIPQHTPQKQCTRCKQWFARTSEFFFRATKSKDGLQTQCKSCIGKPRQSIPEGHKRCKKCGNCWPATLEFFFADKREGDGLRCPCKQCIKEYREVNKETIQSSRRKFYQSHTEEIKRSSSEYAHSHREKGRIYSRVYYAKNRKRPVVPKYASEEERRIHKNARQRAQYRVRYKNNPEYDIARVNKRKARKLQVLGTHTSRQLREQYDRQKGKCYYCSSPIDWGKHHVDHTFPLSRVVGTGIPANDISYLVITCPPCNLKKHDKFPWEWPEGGRLL